MAERVWWKQVEAEHHLQHEVAPTGNAAEHFEKKEIKHILFFFEARYVAHDILQSK